jgi:hypothetical protein
VGDDASMFCIKSGIRFSIWFVLVLLSVFGVQSSLWAEAPSRQGKEDAFSDLQVVSIKVGDVNLEYDLSGKMHRKWKVRITIQNVGAKVARRFNLAVASWRGRNLGRKNDERFLMKKRGGNVLVKKIPSLGPHKRKKLVFTLTTDKHVSKLLLGAWVDSATQGDKIRVCDIVAGKYPGRVGESCESNNYIEKRFSY